MPWRSEPATGTRQRCWRAWPQVISGGIWPDIAAQARRNLAVQGTANVTVIAGDGSAVYPAGGPYDAVIVAAAFPQVAPPLAVQLKADGRLVQPIGPGGNEQVVLSGRRREGLRRLRVLSGTRFVRLHGSYGFPGPRPGA